MNRLAIVAALVGSVLAVAGAAAIVSRFTPPSAVPGVPLEQVPPVDALAKIASLRVRDWSAWVAGDPNAVPCGSAEADGIIDRYTGNGKANPAQASLLTSHRADARAAVLSLGLRGGEGDGFLLDEHPPVVFARRGDELAMVVWPVGSLSEYDAQETTARARAARVFDSLAGPAMRRIHRAVKSDAIAHVGVVVVYGSRDFSDDAAESEGEVLVVVASRRDCAAFDRAEITDQQFLDHADVYLAGPRSSGGGVTKTTLRVE